ncbi:SDR family NAD(P)-dependent oxidoreductase [Streptomyces sp. NPDC002088]|uniref:SDR family NAD(P)-dependent oxidoreductase n=1 Tax=Streptomyces sp. NPDC002088 TaxID=3154665 RepID=UPI003319C6AC
MVNGTAGTGYADELFDVVVASRTYEARARVVAEIEKQTGRTALPHGVRVGRWDGPPGLVGAVCERFGRLDALVNNAGMSPIYDTLGSVTENLFDAVVKPQPQGRRSDSRSSPDNAWRRRAAGGGRRAAGGGRRAAVPS